MSGEHSSRRRATVVARSAGLAVALSMAAISCNGDGEARQGQPLDIEQRHPNGTVLLVTAISFGPGSTTVTIEALNGHTDKIELNSRGSIWLRDDLGARYELVEPEQNADIEIPSGEAVRARLVFAGVPDRRATSLRLLVNAYESEDSIDLTDRSRSSTTPSFQIDELPARR